MRKGLDTEWRIDDFTFCKANDITFAFFKATEGGNVTTKSLEHNVTGALNHGIDVGCYHFFRPDVEVELQADHFRMTLADMPVGEFALPHVLDVETTSHTQADISLLVCKWMDIVAPHCPNGLAIYTTPDFASHHLRSGNRLSRWPLWVAHWKAAKPSVPTMWADWKFWQYEADVRLPGCGVDLDLNWMAD